MKAVVYKDIKKVVVEDVPDPRIEAPGDCIVRITTAAICGSDLHMYDGRSPVEPNQVFGHENMGVVQEVGNACVAVKPGDRVVLPFNVSCGFCFNCIRGYPNACLTTNPASAGGGYGYSGLGPWRGGQAEYLRVPFADYNCLKLPGTPGDDLEDDFILLADIFPTGWHATELAKVRHGDSVAVFGAGPVGLLSAYSAILRGASEVYVIDRAEERLKKAESIGAIAINYTEGDPVEQIIEMRRKDDRLNNILRPEERAKMPGVMAAIDAIGYQAQDTDNPSVEDASKLINQITEVLNPTGRLGIIGVYFPEDPGAETEAARRGEYMLPIGKLWNKGIEIGTGQAPVKRYDVYLRDMITSGRAKPSFIISHRVPLSQAPEAYQLFDLRGVDEGTQYTKVVLKPDMDRAR